jgi:hypothetical protein
MVPALFIPSTCVFLEGYEVPQSLPTVQISFCQKHTQTWLVVLDNLPKQCHDKLVGKSLLK